MKIEMVEQETSAKIKVVGIGGGGGNAINDMIKAQLMGVDFLSANTDAQALGRNQAPVKINLGMTLTKGLGAGGDPDSRPQRRPGRRRRYPGSLKRR